LSVLWQQQFDRHEVIDFNQNARNIPASTPEDLPTSPTRHRRGRPWGNAPQSGVRSVVASKRLHPHIMLDNTRTWPSA
jgi:hypothetical protein